MSKYWKIALAVALGLALMAGVVWANGAVPMTITGTVEDCNGALIEGATVSFDTNSTKTDADGEYTFEGEFLEGSYEFKADASGLPAPAEGKCYAATAVATQTVALECGPNTVDFTGGTCVPAETTDALLWGYVYDCETGKGLPGATVTIKNSGLAPATTDENGYYVFCGELPAAEYQVCAVKSGFEEVCKQWDSDKAKEGFTNNLNFTGKNCLPTSPPTPPEIPVVQVPVIYMDNGWETWIQVQNMGDDPTKVVMELWPESDGSCQPQTYDKVECSGVLQPGAAWTWKLSEDYPGTGSRSAIIYSVVPGTEPTDCFGDGSLVGGEPIAVTVQRTQTNPGADEDYRSSVYNGIPDWVYAWGPDPVTKAYMYYAPLVFNDGGGYGWTSDIWIQNSGDECTSVEIWYHSTCEEWETAQVLALHPAKSVLAPKPSWTGVGSAWIRSSQPLGIVVDHQDAAKTKLLSYTAFPVDYWVEGVGYIGLGDLENYGPLIYREYNGWSAGVQVQNMDSTTNALVKVYFLDQSGDIITTLVDWICKRCSQTFFLPAINNLPGNYVGQFRVHSQNWRTPGDPTVHAPWIMSVVNLINYDTGQGLSYNALPAWAAWHEMLPEYPGVTQLALPFLTKQKHDPFEPTGATWTSKIALTNLVHMSSLSDVVVRIDFFDQNGLLYSICEKLNPKDVDYIDLDNYGVIPPGWLGSAVITVQCVTPFPEDPAAIGAVVVNQAEGYASGDLTTGYTAVPMWWGLPVGWQPPGPLCNECPPLD